MVTLMIGRVRCKPSFGFRADGGYGGHYGRKEVHGYDGRTGRRVPPITMGHEAVGVPLTPEEYAA